MTEEYYDRLVGLALEMVDRVREIGPEHNGCWWRSLTDAEREGVPWVLAAMVDPTASTHELLGWTWAFAPREAA